MTTVLVNRGNGRHSAVEQALKYITSTMDLRHVKPGDRLPSAAQLAVQVGVSRPAVLQALKILASQGRVIVRSGRGGCWVAEHEAENLDARIARAWENRDTILQMAVLREILETGVAKRLGERGMKKGEIATARRLAAAMREGDWDDIDNYRGLDNELHMLLARATGLPIIESMVGMCRAEVAAAFDVMEVPPSRKQTSDGEHDAIIDAIESGDSDAAERVMRQHVGTTTRMLETDLGGDRHPIGNRSRTAREALRKKAEKAKGK